jgi:penicillin-binding protein 1A
MYFKLSLIRKLFYVFIVIFTLFVGTIITFSLNLPDYTQLKNYKPSILTRVHNSSGELVKEYSNQYRVFIPIDAVPDIIKFAFISAEDKNFYKHVGIDPLGIARAFLNNIKNIFSDKRPQGASTITQQVAKNFLLSDELSLTRKIKEAILALKIESTYSKERILELYLNQIYLGSGTYGVAAATSKYFNKPIQDISIEEAAYLAALPKAPSYYHPINNYEMAIARRDWVLNRMYANKYIDENELNSSLSKKLIISKNNINKKYSSDYYSEEVRRRIIDIFGKYELYNGGLSIRTSLNSKLQIITTKALQKGLIDYDKRHGYRGPIDNIKQENWYDLVLKKYSKPTLFDFARIVNVSSNKIAIETNNKQYSNISIKGHDWLRRYINNNYVGKKITNFNEIFKDNDIIYYSKDSFGQNKIEQLPTINGAVIVMDPYSGRVLAMSGGFDFRLSSFNRAIQARRQPGSAFKPFVYLAALENGFQPNTMILDAPFVIDQGDRLGKWKPENYGKKFYGPSPLRKGIENSRNLMTIRIAQYLGMDKVSEIANRSGILEDMPNILSMALGAGETTLINITRAYASFVNGGKKINPIFIDKIQDRRGKTIYKADLGVCNNCLEPYSDKNIRPTLIDEKEMIISPPHAYQITSMLKGAVDRGTGKKTRFNGIEIAGKTGTTNNNTDAWFIGYTSDLIVGVYSGFDKPLSLGKKETGSSVAVPIFKKIINEYLAENNSLPFRVPQGIELIKIDLNTGKIIINENSNTIYEAFGKNDKLNPNSETLIGSEGFVPIQVNEIDEDINLIY